MFKPTLRKNKNALIGKKKGAKEHQMVYNEMAGESPVKRIETTPQQRSSWTLNDDEVLMLARWSDAIEQHYGMPMDIEWGKDGSNDAIYILQARPETVHSQKAHNKIDQYKLKEKGKILCKGKAIGKKIISGRACIIHSLKEAESYKPVIF